MQVSILLTLPGMMPESLSQRKGSSCFMICVGGPESLGRSAIWRRAEFQLRPMSLQLLHCTSVRPASCGLRSSSLQLGGLCLRAIAGHSSVLDPCRQLPCLRLDEARRIAAAMHCTNWENLESILTCGLFYGGGHDRTFT